MWVRFGLDRVASGEVRRLGCVVGCGLDWGVWSRERALRRRGGHSRACGAAGGGGARVRASPRFFFVSSARARPRASSPPHLGRALADDDEHAALGGEPEHGAEPLPVGARGKYDREPRDLVLATTRRVRISSVVSTHT